MASRSCEHEMDRDLCTVVEPRRSPGPEPSFQRNAEASEVCCASPVDVVDRSTYGALILRIRNRLEENERRVGQDLDRGRELFDELMDLPANRREDSIVLDPRFASYTLSDRLAACAEERTDRDPEEAVEMLSLALAVSARLDAARWSRGLVEDLEARCWALLGAAWCESGAAQAAQTAFRLARTHLHQGTGDPLEEAEVLLLEAKLPVSVDPDAGEQRLDRAAAIFLEHGAYQRVGEVLARKGVVRADAGDHEAAVTLLREALPLLEDSPSPRRRAELVRLLARSLLAAGHSEAAWTEIARSRSWLRIQPDPLIEARLQALEGRIALADGLTDQAVALLSAARDALLRLGHGEEAARVHLILIGHPAGECPHDSDGPSREPERLTRDTERLLATGDLSRETTMALLMVDRAADRGTLSDDLVRALDDFLEHSA